MQLSQDVLVKQLDRRSFMRVLTAAGNSAAAASQLGRLALAQPKGIDDLAILQLATPAEYLAVDAYTNMNEEAHLTTLRDTLIGIGGMVEGPQVPNGRAFSMAITPEAATTAVSGFDLNDVKPARPVSFSLAARGFSHSSRLNNHLAKTLRNCDNCQLSFIQVSARHCNSPNKC
jgi:hypothetical protein